MRKKNHIDLLLITDGKKFHYVLIKDMSKLFASEISNNKEKKYFCKRCLMNFRSEEKLKEHKVLCNKCDKGYIKMPDICSFVYLKNWIRSMKHPMVMFADIESILIEINENHGGGTNRYQNHKMISYCILVQYINNKGQNKLILKSYRAKDDEDVAMKFVEKVEKITTKLSKIEANKKLTSTKEDLEEYKKATVCWICKETFKKYNKDSDDNKIKVRDHDHYTGKYRGTAHKDCNLKLKIPKFIPIIFHNGSGYDFHLIIEALAKTDSKITVISQNEEQYMSISKKVKVGTCENKKGKEINKYFETRYIDSFKFMNTGLDKLVNNLLKCDKCDSCKPGDCMKKYFEDGKIKIFNGIGRCDKCINCLNSKKSCKNPMINKLKNTSLKYKDKLHLLIRKGVFPYDYFNSSKRFDEDKLPCKESFYNILTDNHISDNDYEYANKIWKEFDMKTFGDYHDLYLNTDVLLLSDVFNEFRKICLKNYELDPLWYYTAPGLSWDALLKHSDVRLELLSDYDMLLMFEQGTRGGISTITKTYAVANNKYMSSYDENEESKYLMYLDANNLYGWTMSLPLPIGEFEWMSDEELENWRNISCILMIDVDYPNELHDKHNDYPFLCENMRVGKVNKLIPNLYDKKIMFVMELI